MNAVGVRERRGSEHLEGWVARIGLLGLLLALSAGPALAAPTIDGLVQASDMYDFSFIVTFETQGGASTADQFGSFHVHDDGSSISVGLVAPVELDDNTYGTTRASDWGTKRHELEDGGPSKSLEGSDEWAINKFGPNNVDITLDYLEAADGGSVWVPVDDKGNLEEFGTSISYNFHTLGHTSFFNAGPADSPAMVCPGMATRCTSYDFSATAAGWVAAIMYEFKVSKTTLGVGDINTLAAAEVFAEDLLAASTIHMSPNKEGKNKRTVTCCDPPDPPDPPTSVPEPGSIALFGIGLAALGAMRRRKTGK